MSNDMSGLSNHILPVSAQMTGVCITVLSILRLTGGYHPFRIMLIAMLAIDSLIFLISACLSYMSLRTLNKVRLEKYADIIFLTGMSLMVAIGFVLAWKIERYELWC